MSKIILLITIFFSLGLYASTSLNKIFDQLDFSSDEREEIFLQSQELKSSEVSQFQVTTDQNALYLKLYVNNFSEAYIIEKSNGHISLEVIATKIKKEIKRYDGVIRGSIFNTILEDFQDEKLANLISNSFSDEFTTTKGLRVEAKYLIEIEEVYDNEILIKNDKLLRTTLIVGKAIEEKVYNDKTDKLEIILPVEEERNFISPLGTYDFSSRFNLARRHPLKRKIQPHNGIDMRARSGTPIHPAMDGYVVAKGRGKAKGKFVVIQHANGMQSTYDHMRKFSKNLRIGDYVVTSETIGEVGRTGYATGAHLHFGLIKNGLYVNPIYYFKDLNLSISTDSLDTETSDSEEE